jgi:uncharacterized membrane protein YbhN (UPF0104 family)
MRAQMDGHGRRGLAWAARLLVAAGFVTIILHNLNLGEFRAVVIAPQWLPLAGMAGAGLLFMLLGGFNIWIMLSALEPVRLATVLRHYVVATSLGTFTPAALGDFSLVSLLRREGIPVHRGLSVMLVDRGVTLALYGLVYLPLTLLLILAARQWLWLPVVLGAAAALVLGLNLIASLRRWLRERVVRRFLPQLEELLRSGSDLLRAYPAYLLADVAVTVARSVVSGVVIDMALLAAGIRGGFFPVVVLTNSLSLLNYLPISLSGVGVYEGGAVALFTRLGLSSERVFAAFVFQRAYIIVSSLLWFALSRLLLPGARRSGLATEARVKP